MTEHKTLAEVLGGHHEPDEYLSGNPGKWMYCGCGQCIKMPRRSGPEAMGLLYAEHLATVVADWLRSDEVREVVAEAIHASLDAPDSAAGDWGDLHEHIRNGWRAHAEDVLRALVAQALGEGA